MAAKLSKMITAEKDGRVKQFRSLVWELLSVDSKGLRQGWKLLSESEIPIEAIKKMVPPVDLPEKVSINKPILSTPPEAVKQSVIKPTKGRPKK